MKATVRVYDTKRGTDKLHAICNSLFDAEQVAYKLNILNTFVAQQRQENVKALYFVELVN